MNVLTKEYRNPCLSVLFWVKLPITTTATSTFQENNATTGTSVESGRAQVSPIPHAVADIAGILSPLECASPHRLVGVSFSHGWDKCR